MSIPEWKLVGWTEGPRECALRCEAVNCTFATADGRHAAADGQFIGVSLLHCQMGVARVAAPMSEERLIKKYANRRLYDASQSRHITLDDIRALIVKGEKIKVVEDKTGHDITRHILLQVIAEQEQFGRPILSTPVLESIIRFYGSSMQGFLASFLEKSIETF